MYSTAIAYLLWFLSGFGALGLHRFYLGKIGTGLLWFFTGGMFMVGSIYDFFTMPVQVRDANLRQRYRRALYWEGDIGLPPSRSASVPARPKESLERVILRTAKKNRGVATPAEVALEGDIPVEEAKEHLEKLVSKGHAEMRVRKSGAIVYVFPDFVEEADARDFEDF